MVEQRIKLRLVLPSDNRAPGIARKELARFARGVELDDGEYDAVRLLVSELVTNAVRHGGARGGEKIGVYVQSSDATIRIEVRDHGLGFELPQPTPAPGADGGYGLLIVDRLSSRWGVERNDESVVWCELDCLAAA